MLTKSIKREIKVECFCQIKNIIMLIILSCQLYFDIDQYNLPPLLNELYKFKIKIIDLLCPI